MKTTASLLALVLAAALAGPAAAQDKPAEPETVEGGLSLGEPATPQVGEPYKAADHGDWRITCVKTETGKDPCQMYQLLVDQEGNAVAEVTVFDVPGNPQVAAGATFITPLGTLLTAQATLSVDEAEGKRYPFSWCLQNGCYARVGLTPLELDNLRRGKQASLAIRAVQAPDQPVVIPVSLNGFAAAFRDLKERTPQQ